MLYVRLTLVLAFVSAIAAGILALTYRKTEPAIITAQEQEQKQALGDVFFEGFQKSEEVSTQTSDGNVRYYKVYVKGDTTEPSFYALTGKAIGYNKSVPIELLVGFRNPAKNAGKIDPAKGLICYNWRVVNSAETPGLGENAKDSKPSFTILGKLSGEPDDTGSDRRTKFQRQFSDKSAQELVVKKNIDIITGSTYTTAGIVNAVKDADRRLRMALNVH